MWFWAVDHVVDPAWWLLYTYLAPLLLRHETTLWHQLGYLLGKHNMSERVWLCMHAWWWGVGERVCIRLRTDVRPTNPLLVCMGKELVTLDRLCTIIWNWMLEIMRKTSSLASSWKATIGTLATPISLKQQLCIFVVNGTDTVQTLWCTLVSVRECLDSVFVVCGISNEIAECAAHHIRYLLLQ